MVVMFNEMETYVGIYNNLQIQEKIYSFLV